MKKLDAMGMSAEHRITAPVTMDFDAERWLVQIPKLVDERPADTTYFVRKSDCEAILLLGK